MTIDRWLKAWGYADAEGLYRPDDALAPTYAYRAEVTALLDPEGPVRARAVFDIAGVPTVCFLSADDHVLADDAALDEVRRVVWNQNLLSVILVVGAGRTQVIPATRAPDAKVVVALQEATPTGPYSRRDLQSGDLFSRHKEWFAPENRVDHDLLKSLALIINDLTAHGIDKLDAQYLIAQVLFVSYLEHRNIVGDDYRSNRGVGKLRDLVRMGDGNGVTRLLGRLKADFNGDFLEPETAGSSLWSSLPARAFSRLDQFLGRTDLESNQQSLWAYDFSYLPVETLSGVYETFLSDEKKAVGAYYTPRNLANFAVDQAFHASPDILSEKVFDGACGSGILLTTAYRRMLSFAAAKNGRSLSFIERSRILTERIFGSDINESACRVTAFSLYLALLEGLQPSDISRLQNEEGVKLPKLSERNLAAGTLRGDFFSPSNAHLANGLRASIALSNPPWLEPKGKEQLSSDVWAAERGIQLARRNVAGAFMVRVADFLDQNGRACLILPVSMVAARTSGKFVRAWLQRFRLRRLINFGDLRKLLFPTAKQPCAVAIFEPRRRVQDEQRRAPETFEYWVPKADVSFAFGRLSMHGSDRHELQTDMVSADNTTLVTYYWGAQRDVALIESLRLKGTLGAMVRGSGPWRHRKGFHQHDSAVAHPVPTRKLHDMAFIDAKDFQTNGPALEAEVLSAFPADDIPTAASLPDDLLDAFAGPKILFVDGMTSDRAVRAAFTAERCTFTSSIGMISGPRKDEDLMRFTAAYLHSALARYVWMMTAYQVSFERERITLADMQGLPFIDPRHHVDPARAKKIVKTVAAFTRRFEVNRKRLLREDYDPRECDDLFFEYFGVDKLDANRVREIVSIAPHLQPSSVKALSTPLQQRPSRLDADVYAGALKGEISRWSKMRGGRGSVDISVRFEGETCGPLGIVAIEPSAAGSRGQRSFAREDAALQALLAELSNIAASPLELSKDLYLAADIIVECGERMYIVKPLIRRLWLHSAAYEDARRLVERVVLRRPSEAIAG